jgi:hypothetical protein
MAVRVRYGGRIVGRDWRAYRLHARVAVAGSTTLCDQRQTRIGMYADAGLFIRVVV